MQKLEGLWLLEESQPSDSTVILVYTVRADRGGASSIYAAQCSSTYVRTGSAWRLAMHQQSPQGAA